MAASLTKTLFAVVAIFIFIEMATAADFNFEVVWEDITDLVDVASKIYDAGDKLNFVYDNIKHSVVEVSKQSFDSCNTASPIEIHNSGNDTIPLNLPGRRYFICGDSTHCATGMKLQIDTAGTPTTSSPVNSNLGGTTLPSAAGWRALEGKVAAAGLIGAGMIILLAV